MRAGACRSSTTSSSSSPMSTRSISSWRVSRSARRRRPRGVAARRSACSRGGAGAGGRKRVGLLAEAGESLGVIPAKFLQVVELDLNGGERVLELVVEALDETAALGFERLRLRGERVLGARGLPMRVG